MEKTIKIISTIMLIIAICFSSTVVFAQPPAGQSGTGSTVSSEYIPKPSADSTVANQVSGIGSNIAGIIQVAGMSIAVIILIYIGIRYIVGSAEDQANYKKSMIPYLVGAVILFLASFLVGVIYDFATNIQASGV